MLVFSDAHFEGHETVSFKIMCEVMKDLDVDIPDELNICQVGEIQDELNSENRNEDCPVKDICADDCVEQGHHSNVKFLNVENIK